MAANNTPMAVDKEQVLLLSDFNILKLGKLILECNS